MSYPKILSKVVSGISISNTTLTITYGDGTTATATIAKSNSSTSAEKDSKNQVISNTYVKNVTVSGTTLSLEKGDGTKTTATLPGGTVSFTQKLTSGVELGTITINGTATKLYCQDTNTTYNVVTTSANGLMSKDMLTKLNGIQTGATAVSFSRSLTSGTKIGTITINGNGTDIYCSTPTSVSDASTSAKGIVQLSSATNSSSETLAATPKAVKAAYDLAAAKFSAVDASTAVKGIVQLSSATNSSSETLAATPKAVKAAYDLANTANTAATTANSNLSKYMPIAGGTFTGGVFEAVVDMGSGTAIQVNKGGIFKKTVSANTTFTITGANQGATFSLILVNGGSKTVTWPSSVKWTGGSVPTLTESGTDVLTFITGDSGTTWYGVLSSSSAA